MRGPEQEAAWAIQAQCGDHDAMEQALRSVQPPLHRYILRLVGPAPVCTWINSGCARVPRMRGPTYVDQNPTTAMSPISTLVPTYSGRREMVRGSTLVATPCPVHVHVCLDPCHQTLLRTRDATSEPD